MEYELLDDLACCAQPGEADLEWPKRRERREAVFFPEEHGQMD